PLSVHFYLVSSACDHDLHPFPTRRSSDLRYDFHVVDLRILPRADHKADLARTECIVRRPAHFFTIDQYRQPVAGHSQPDTVPFADRKSTRLNSSHVKISYAVFCLKKKNKY